MDRRHQVFISSTYADLVDERAEVIQALLELDCIPAGMELFPATTESAWELIKGVIDDSDYYCLIIGGRYGSISTEGVSYTEKEYDYAVLKNKPVMAFVHGRPEEIPSGKVEKTDRGRELLDAFRAKVEAAHHRRTWSTASELGGLVSRSLINLRKANPAEGWVRGRFAATEALLVEVANLRARVAELQAQEASKPREIDPEVTEKLASGSDEYRVGISCIESGKKDRETLAAGTTWDQILRYVGPALLSECSDEEFEAKLKLCFYHSLELTNAKKVDYKSVVVPHVVVDEIKIQLQALGQMVPGTKRRAVADKQAYWRLTEIGEKRLLSAQAIRKPVKPQGVLEGALSALTQSVMPKMKEADPTDGQGPID